MLEREGLQGWIAFADNQFLGAELGALVGKPAIEAMLGWSDGRFEFEARVDAAVLARTPREPLSAVVLEAVCARDERERPKPAQKRRVPVAPTAVIAPATTFEIDVEQEEVARTSLEKTEQAVLDLARSGMSLERIQAIIPESPEDVQSAIASLIEMGVLSPR